MGGLFLLGFAVVAINAIYLMQTDPSGASTVAYIIATAIVYAIAALWLYWNKLPFKLNERHIEEIKRMKADAP